MQPFVVTGLIFTFISSLVPVKATPIGPDSIQDISPRSNKLLRRSDYDIGYLSFCQSCVSTPTCTQLRMMTWGEEGSWEGGCDDPASVFEDACSTQDREVETPYGNGYWTPVADCEDYNEAGDEKGIITSVEDNEDSFTYKCWYSGEQYSETCLIQTWACTVTLECWLIGLNGEPIEVK